MSETVGAFLKTKLCNMAQWIENEVGGVDFSPVQFAQMRTELEVVMLAQIIAGKPAIVANRDWLGLVKLLDSEAAQMAQAVSCLLHSVKAREDLHPKFWRYMELFRDVINKSNE